MISETIWDITLTCLIGAFCGLVAGQFVAQREMVLTCVMIGMAIFLVFLTIYYGFLAWREWKREQRKNKRNARGGYSR